MISESSIIKQVKYASTAVFNSAAFSVDSYMQHLVLVCEFNTELMY